MKITSKNYFEQIRKIGFDKLPEPLKKSHLVIMTKTDLGKDWSVYKRDKEFQKMVDLAFEKLQGWLMSKKRKGLSGKSENKMRFREELKFLTWFLNLHDEFKTRDEILFFIDDLQAAIRAKKIRKISFFAQEIILIQKELIDIYNNMKGNSVRVRVDAKISKKILDAITLIQGKNEGKNYPDKDDINEVALSGHDSDEEKCIGNSIMRSTDFADIEFHSLGLKEPWKSFVGDLPPGFTAMIFGKPKMGKSYLSVDWAGYFARNHGKVLYVAKEEGFNTTLQIKLKDKNVAHPDLFVSDHLPANLAPYDFIFLDSVNSLGLTAQDLRALKSSNPSKSFIYIFQATKDGNFRGANEFQHDVDVVIEVPERGKAVQFGRFNQGGEIDIFEKEQSLSGVRAKNRNSQNNEHFKKLLSKK